MDDKEHRGNCLAMASGLNKIDDNSNKVSLTPDEVVEAATKFINFINSAEQQKDNQNG